MKLEDESWQALTNYLIALRGPKLWRCYGFPVFWKDGEEAYEHGIVGKSATTVNDWWKYTFAFESGYCLYAGFFNTVVDGWDRTKARPGQKPTRQSWVAVYRPVDPFQRPYTEMQLVIWDMAAKERFPGNTPVSEQDLTEAQQAIIRCVRKNTGTKNEGSFLSQVWLGGFGSFEVFENDLDTTITHLETMLSRRQEALPSEPERMSLTGFKPVRTIDHDMFARP